MVVEIWPNHATDAFGTRPKRLLENARFHYIKDTLNRRKSATEKWKDKRDIPASPDEFNRHFTSVMPTAPPRLAPMAEASSRGTLFDFKQVSLSDVTEALSSAHSNALGPDDISLRHLKECGCFSWRRALAAMHSSLCVSAEINARKTQALWIGSRGFMSRLGSLDLPPIVLNSTTIEPARKNFLAICLLASTLRTKSPEYLFEQVEFMRSDGLGSKRCSHLDLHIKPIDCKYFRNSFRIGAAYLWNCLPHDLRLLYRNPNSLKTNL
ncbi:hypothetical protein TSAR_001313 [Trichomalopsis sarcophagae]|uniref:Uncharacterized protein n=1 Tax=Trichomalopsis sarcophagae TaxID=543379 RepID=A0A232FKT5_9HYME|nr:hypothetical protein TSAR_001313 [Trichomalopsis sarcophagae]